MKEIQKQESRGAFFTHANPNQEEIEQRSSELVDKFKVIRC